MIWYIRLYRCVEFKVFIKLSQLFICLLSLYGYVLYSMFFNIMF